MGILANRSLFASPNNEFIYHLLKYASEENSVIAKRFTDLFSDVFHEDVLDIRPQVVQIGDQFFEERLVHKTARGELVRSKSEVIIANALHYSAMSVGWLVTVE